MVNQKTINKRNLKIVKVKLKIRNRLLAITINNKLISLLTISIQWHWIIIKTTIKIEAVFVKIQYLVHKNQVKIKIKIKYQTIWTFKKKIII